jgi:transcriptional regulator with XRE-family HTH domain
MSQDVTLSDRVAEEIRALLARRRISGRQLAESTGMSQSAVSARLTGVTAIDLDDLERIATALDVEITALLPVRSHNKTLSPPPVRPTGPRSQRALLAPGHTPERHLNGRPASETSGASRTELRRPAITRHTHSGSST